MNPSPSRRCVHLIYANPGAYPPVINGCRVLSDAGWQIVVLGAGSPGTGELHFPTFPSVVAKRFRYRGSGWRQRLNVIAFTLWAIAKTVVLRPRLVFASDALSTPAALLSKVLIPKTTLIYHEHDIPYEPQAGTSIRLVNRVRDVTVRRADMVIVPSDRRRQFLPAFAGDKTVVVPNCPTRAHIRRTPTAPAPRSVGGLTIIYTGSISPERVPLSVLEALIDLPQGIRLRVVGYAPLGQEMYLEELRLFAKNAGLGERVEWLPPVSLRELNPLIDESDVGLAVIAGSLKDPNHRSMAGASNKAFHYLARGIPIVAPQLPDWQHLFVEPGYARGCDPNEVTSIRNTFLWFHEHPAERREMGEAGRQRIREEWNYEAMLQPLIERWSYQ